MSAENFELAAEEVKAFGDKLTNDDKQTVYSLYKQATVGDVNIPRPGMFDLTGKAKWDAWNSRKGTFQQNTNLQLKRNSKYLKGMSQEDAKAEYVKAVKAIASRLGLNDVAERL